MIQAVCFDLDGTLVDSERLYLAGNVYAAQALDLNLTTEAFMPLVGASAEAFQRRLDLLIPQALQAEFVTRTQAFVDTRIAESPSLARSSADWLLHTLKKQQIKLALVTVSGSDYTKRMLANTQWQAVFNVVVTGEAGASKPAPDLYLEALAQLRLQASVAIAVEDSDSGIRAAHAAGLKAVQLLDLAPQSQHADRIITNFFEIEKMVLG